VCKPLLVYGDWPAAGERPWNKAPISRIRLGLVKRILRRSLTEIYCKYIQHLEPHQAIEMATSSPAGSSGMSEFSLPKGSFTPELMLSLASVRRYLHSQPETAFLEKDTSALIKKHLLELGVGEKEVRSFADTGLVVDIRGTGPIRERKSDTSFAKVNADGTRIIALRSDIDALPMTEASNHLPHRS